MKYWYSILSLLISVSAFAQSGNALYFNGGAVVNGGNDASVNLTTGTWEAWVNFDDLNDSRRIIFKQNSSGTGMYELFYYVGSNVFRAEVIVGGNRYAVQSTTQVTDLTWYHVAATYDGNVIKIYVNGVLEGTSGIIGGNIDVNDGELAIGGNTIWELSTSVTMMGVIDEVRIWNSVRTQQQIASTMNIPLGTEYTTSTDSGLVAYYPFDEESGSTSEDKSINSNVAVLSGTVFIPSGVTLPVELTDFSAQSNNGNITLNWSTASESNNAGWEVEVRSFDLAQRDDNLNSQGNKNTPVIQSPSADGSEAFQKIGFIAGKGTTTEKQNYLFQIEGSQFQTQNLEFRLKQIDLNGKFSYSNILTVELTPKNFELSQNYPNPFNPNTIIGYQLSTVAHVKLIVYDLLGREVATLVNEQKGAGNYSVNFDGRNLTSGIYFYTITFNNHSETKSMMLMK